MPRITSIAFLACLSCVSAVSIFPYHPYNIHLQDYIRTQLDFHHPRNEWGLRTLYQDDTTRCKLRLWRLTGQGKLSCQDDSECHYGTVCRTLKVCKLTQGRLCWAKESTYGPCVEDKDCESNHCNTYEGSCGYPLYKGHVIKDSGSSYIDGDSSPNDDSGSSYITIDDSGSSYIDGDSPPIDDSGSSYIDGDSPPIDDSGSSYIDSDSPPIDDSGSSYVSLDDGGER